MENILGLTEWMTPDELKKKLVYVTYSNVVKHSKEYF